MFCMECGAKVDKNAKFCMECGEKVKKKTQEFEINKKPKLNVLDQDDEIIEIKIKNKKKPDSLPDKSTSSKKTKVKALPKKKTDDTVSDIVRVGEDGRSFFKNDKLIYEGDTNYSGMCHGWGKTYNEKGNLIYEGKFKNNLYHGKGRWYYDNSRKLAYEGKFKNGKPHGKGKSYDKNGSIVHEGEFSNGEPVSYEWMEWVGGGIFLFIMYLTGKC